MKTSAAGPRSGYLGSIANNVSRSDEGDVRIVRFALQAAARELAPASRVRVCLRAIVPGRDNVEVWHSPARQRAYYKNLITCNRVWICPVCAAKISERRRQEITRALAARDLVAVPDTDGRERVVSVPRFYTAMATYTISHKSGEALADVLGRLQAAYRRSWQGRWAKAWQKRHRVIGTLRAIEVTHGVNGWHPHIHLLLFRDSANTEGSIRDMDIEMTLRWQDVTEAVGASASLDRGVTLSPGDEKAGNYPFKMDIQVDAAIRRWGIVDELTKYPVKHGRADSRSLWDLLADYVGGDVHAGELWIEAQAALRGTMFLRPSNGLWKALQAPDSIGSDDEMGKEPENVSDAILASLTVDQWRAVVIKNRRGELLEVASAGDPARVAAFLSELGVEHLS